jgi:RNA polymerase sigma factor (TIGR02999 family)
MVDAPADFLEIEDMENSELPILVRSAESGSVADREQLFTRLYAELHRIAQSELRRNSAATISPTTLLHETFLNLSQNVSAAFANRGQFLSYAARAMRGLLIDYLRTRHAQKRGGLFEITSLPTELSYVAEEIELQRLAAALDSLAQVDARLAECVDLKYFCGFSNAEIADFWNVSVRTVAREWDKARVLLQQFMAVDAEDGKTQ